MLDRMFRQDLKIGALQFDIQLWQQDLQRLQEDLQEDVDLLNAKVTQLESKIILSTKKTFNGGGGLPLPAKEEIAVGQNKVLELASQLAGSTEPLPDITYTTIAQGLSPFASIIEQLLPNITPGEGMTPEQQEQLAIDLETGITAAVLTGLSTNLFPDVNTIKNQTTQDAIATGTEQGICQSLNNPNACPVTPTSPEPTQGLKGLKDFFKNTFGSLSDQLGAANLGANLSIYDVVKNTNDAVRSSSYGLQAINNFINTAWQAANVDKVLNAINTIGVLHNAMMLSHNIGETLGETISIGLNAIGIKDSTTGEAIDINGIVKSKLNALITAIIFLS